jgi:hypothetical protein
VKASLELWSQPPLESHYLLVRLSSLEEVEVQKRY